MSGPESKPRTRSRIAAASLRRPPAAEQHSAPVEDHWLEIPARSMHFDGVIRLREPADTDLMHVLQMIRDGSYTKPFVIDDGISRSLHFDFRSVQSEMLIENPTQLTFAYTRKMMSFLLFNPDPRHIVIVGLGGGSLTRFCYNALPQSRLTTLEISRDVLALADLFHIPANDQRNRVLHADAADYFGDDDCEDDEPADVVLIDGCDRWGTAPVFCDASFYANLRQRMHPDGLLVVNMTGLDNRRAAMLRAASEVFTNQQLRVKVRGGNHLLFAFNAPGRIINWSAIQQRARNLEQRHGLNFPMFACKLRQGLHS
ncbi:MAG: spermidine synthase [Pseudomonadota bacterium]|nr:spermidine synthase [Pseudomonadota bacterium]